MDSVDKSLFAAKVWRACHMDKKMGDLPVVQQPAAWSLNEGPSQAPKEVYCGNHMHQQAAGSQICSRHLLWQWGHKSR